MPDAPTTRLGLYKSASDGSEDVNYTQDIGQNLDKLDAAVGFQAVTSSTRPSSPYSGKPITETDTAYRTYFSNGTAPASASWVQIPNSSSTFNADLDLTSGKQINVGGSGSTAAYAALLSSATGDYILSSRVGADSVSRLALRADGRIELGSGSTSADTNLYRGAADTLQTDDSLIVGGNLTVTGVGGRTFVRKTADETVTSSSTYQDDDQLSLAVVSGAVYRVEGYIVYQTVSAAGINLRLTGPTGTGLWTFFAVNVSGGTTDSGAVRTAPGSNGTGNGYLGGSGTNMSAFLRGTFLPTASGTLQLAWSQNNSNATGTILRANSWLELVRVA